MISSFTVATSVEHALQLKREAGSQGVFLAGGTEINRLGTQLTGTIAISLANLPIQSIEKDKNAVTIGTMATLQRIIDTGFVPDYMKVACRFCVSRTRRNMATVGGNLALQRDDSYLMPTVVAAKARLILATLGPDGSIVEENIPIREYLAFKDHFSDSLLLAIVLNKPTRFVSSKRIALTEQSMASVTVALGSDLSSKEIHDVRLCTAVKGSGVFRIPEIEETIANGTYEPVDEPVVFSLPAVEFVDDFTGSATYKRYILGTAIADLFRECRAALGKGGQT
ncbi:MAG: FAD binding domain-containing protein [Sphaerochaetaceae bacterium]|nr:FAD binding domain-containing protein [Sphaerochaetaceae bacterium]